MDKIDLTFNKTCGRLGRWKKQSSKCQGVLNYARIEWAKALKKVVRVAIYDNVLTNFVSR